MSVLGNILEENIHEPSLNERILNRLANLWVTRQTIAREAEGRVEKGESQEGVLGERHHLVDK